MYKRSKSKRATRATPAQVVQYHRVAALVTFSLGRAAILERRPLPTEAPQTTHTKRKTYLNSNPVAPQRPRLRFCLQKQ